MEPENETETAQEVDAVIVDTGGSETLVVDLPSEENASADDEHGEANGAGKSDAVAIAEIEAEKEVAVAAIHAGVEEARIEAEVERVKSWEEEAAEIRASMKELTSLVETLMQSPGPVEPLIQTPLPDLPEMAAEIAEEVATEAESNSTAEFTSAPTSETLTEVSLENADEKQVVAEVIVKRRRRLI